MVEEVGIAVEEDQTVAAEEGAAEEVTRTKYDDVKVFPIISGDRCHLIRVELALASSFVESTFEFQVC